VRTLEQCYQAEIRATSIRKRKKARKASTRLLFIKLLQQDGVENLPNALRAALKFKKEFERAWWRKKHGSRTKE
jgi:hypothetical protein